jgi:hypothetical protein
MKTMTKEFKATPLPPRTELSSADLNYIEKGPGKDHAAQKDQEMRLAFILPVKLHTRFKTVCAARGLKMADEIRVLLERRIEELENGQKKEASVTQLRQLLGEATNILDREFLHEVTGGE